MQARNFLAPDEIFKGEVEETIDKVRKANKVLLSFKESYEEHRKKLKDYFKDGAEPREWEFASELVFGRYDLFTMRVQTIEVSTYDMVSCLNDSYKAKFYKYWKYYSHVDLYHF